MPARPTATFPATCMTDCSNFWIAPALRAHPKRMAAFSRLPSPRAGPQVDTSAQPGATATSQTLSGSTAKRPGPETGTSAGRDVVLASRVDPSAAVAPRRGDGGRGGTVNETLSELRDG
jgi:hypothetical protein